MSESLLFVVRHGNTFDPGDVVRRVGGRTDLPLSASGWEQASRLGRHFRECAPGLASARCGPLLRTRQTAEAIIDALDAPPALEMVPFLREVDYGPDENCPEADVVARIGTLALEDWESRAIPPAGWRVDPDAIIGNWQSLLQDLADMPGAHLVVTSNGIARFALQAAGASALNGKLGTGAYGIIRLGDAPSIVVWNVRPPAAGG